MFLFLSHTALHVETQPHLLRCRGTCSNVQSGQEARSRRDSNEGTAEQRML